MTHSDVDAPTILYLLISGSEQVLTGLRLSGIIPCVCLSNSEMHEVGLILESACGKNWCYYHT